MECYERYSDKNIYHSEILPCLVYKVEIGRGHKGMQGDRCVSHSPGKGQWDRGLGRWWWRLSKRADGEMVKGQNQ